MKCIFLAKVQLSLIVGRHAVVQPSHLSLREQAKFFDFPHRDCTADCPNFPAAFCDKVKRICPTRELAVGLQGGAHEVPPSSSGSAAALGRQVDELVAGLCQLRDGHAASLPDELGHRVQLLRRDVDELPPVINHTCGGKREGLGP